MTLATPSSIQKLQMALHAKAKDEPEYRFYLLYDKVYRGDVLQHAYACCKANKGAAGVDDERFEDIEAYGVERWLGELAEDLRKKTYGPQAVRRVYLKKPNGKLRPIGIPPIRDRVVQTAAVLVLTPIFEADLPAEQHGYRPERNALTAVREVHSLLNTGHTRVVEADLSGYFDSLPHAELMTSVARRVVDRQMLHLIKMWLEAPVEGTDERGRKRRTTQNRDSQRGVPQGSPISPLLANLYMRRFILGWKRLGCEARYQARIVSYADDFVICCKGSAEEAMAAMRRTMERLKLVVNEEKTRTCEIPGEHFDFLGYTFGRCYSTKTGRAYIGTCPSKKSVQRLTAAISTATTRRTTWREAEAMVEQLNRMLRGWAQYFCLGPVDKAYRAVHAHTTQRLRRWLGTKHKVRRAGFQRYPAAYLHQTLGLVELPKLTPSFPWAKA
jgi:RNA-directed DNA polymerase